MSAAELLVVGNPPRARVSTRFLRSELKIIFGRRRNIAGLGVLAAVPVILAVSAPRFLIGPGRRSRLHQRDCRQRTVCSVRSARLGAAVVLALGGQRHLRRLGRGRGQPRHLRYLLAIPAGRTRLLVIKYFAIVIFAFAATFLVALVGSIMGLALFGGGDMTLLSGTQTSLADGVWRLVLSSLYLAAQFSALGAIGLFVSTLTEQPIGATIAIVLVNVLMFILDSIAQLDWLHPWLLTHWWTAFGDLLRDPIATESIQRGLITALVYAGVFWLAAWARLSTKDISS